jgi:hypothetical protein
MYPTTTIFSRKTSIAWGTNESAIEMHKHFDFVASPQLIRTEQE